MSVLKRLEVAARIVWCILTATLYQLVFLVVDIAGFILVPLAIFLGVHRRSKITGEYIFTAPDFLDIYGNEQDGYDPPWAIDTLYKGWPRFLRRYSWAAWRNSSSNKRFYWTTWLHLPPNPKRIKFIRLGPASWVCWQGWRHNWQWARIERQRWTEIGWRYNPTDAEGVSPADWRRFGCGVAFRLNGRW